MFSELIGEFNGQRVVDYQAAKSWEGPDVAYRLREEYEDEHSIAERLDALLAESGSERLTTLLIGAWSGACEGGSSAEIVEKLVTVATRLPKLRGLFFGEMTYEECEVSWIVQADVSPLLAAFPKLEMLRIRGGTGLTFSRVRNTALKELAIETGGLSLQTIRELFLCDLPSLEHLELFLGEGGYGFDGSVEDLQPLLSGRLYPQLKYLGLMNSEIANDIAAVVVNSPVVERIDTLDLSLGNMTDEGARSLLALAPQKHLKRLDISHHYASQDVVDELQKVLPFEVVAEDRQEPEDGWRPVVHAE